MNHSESNLIFDIVDAQLKENGFYPKEGFDKRYLFKDGYMAFNCPHMCSSLRLFNTATGRQLLVDVRTSFGKPYEDNRQLATDFINRVIEKTNGEDNSIPGGTQVAV